MEIKILFVFLAVTVFSCESGRTRIVGGNVAEDGKYPYQVSIRNRGVHDCGGAIIDTEWILTAAHCLTGRLASKLTVVVGTNTLDSGGEIYNVTKIIPHHDFSHLLGKDDIGLIQLDRPLQYSLKVQPINLTTKTPPLGSILTLTGWGQLDVDDLEVPNNLQVIQLQSISYLRCSVAHGFWKIWYTNLCTFTKSGEGACSGDSGGPLVYKNSVAGIVSWSVPCATGRPDVFTDVSYYLSWISSNKNS